MTNFNELPDDHDGLCPECRQAGKFRNIGEDHWFYCETHKTRWWAGSNLYSGWRYENDAIWRENAAYLSAFIEVKPYYHPREPRVEWPQFIGI